MLLIKVFHISAMVAWFAGLFYLPRLFVYHAMSDDENTHQKFCVMERKLYRGIMTPAMIVTFTFGLILGHWFGFSLLWVQLKIMLASVLVGYHFYCGHVLKLFAQKNNQKGHVFYRWLNEMPVLFLIAIVALVVYKPTL